MTGTVVTDIAAHLPVDTLAGIVYLTACPYIGPIMQTIGTPFILNLLTDIASSDDATTTDDSMQIFFNSCFVNPSTIPWETRALWQGFSTFQRPRHRRFVISRSQDPSGLLALGAKGVPNLTLIGSKDPQISYQPYEKEVRSIFSNSEFHVLEGAGHSIHFENRDEDICFRAHARQTIKTPSVPLHNPKYRQIQETTNRPISNRTKDGGNEKNYTGS